MVHATRQGETPEHGKHTLKVWRGKVVAVFGDDVFVELGPRMQGVCSLRSFARAPSAGDTYDFTLRGLEAGLWSVALKSEESLQAWEEMVLGALVQARVVREAPGGLEVKIGRLHGFLPRSHSGLPREKKVAELVGRTLPCEVIEVDAQRQRVVVSRRLTKQKEKLDERVREAERLKIGATLSGRVVRVEDYGAFVALGRGLEGLVHISNLSHARLAHPGEVVAPGQVVEVKVLSIRDGGRRIGLGVKQLQESPWTALERTIHAGQVLEGVVLRAASFGVFVEVAGGAHGLVPLEECGSDPRLSNGFDRIGLVPGAKVLVRVVEFDLAGERLKLSLQHAAGGRLTDEDVADHAPWLAEGGRGGSASGGVRPASAKASPSVVDEPRFTRHSQSVERLIADAKRRPRAG